MKRSFFIFCCLFLTGFSYAQSSGLSSVEIFSGKTLLQKFNLAPWDHNEMTDKIEYYEGQVLNYTKREYDPETNLRISEKNIGADGLLSFSEKYFYEDSLLVGIYRSDSKGRVTTKFAIDYNEKGQAIKVQRLNGYEFSQAEINWEQKFAIIRFFKNNKYIAHMSYRFSLQGLTLSKPEHFKSFFKICPMIELEPGIEQKFFKVDQQGYKYEVESTSSKCQKIGEKLTCQSEFIKKSINGQILVRKKVVGQYIKNPKPEDLTYGPMFAGFEKPLLPLSVEIILKGGANLTSQMKISLNDKGLIELYHVEVLMANQSVPNTAQILFNYNSEGKLERIVNPKGEIIFKY